MKIPLRKNMVEEKRKARVELDAIMVPRINDALGPKASLYAIKLLCAINNELPDSDEVIRKHNESKESVLKIDELRQKFQGQIDSAKTTFDIERILNEARNGAAI